MTLEGMDEMKTLSEMMAKAKENGFDLEFNTYKPGSDAIWIQSNWFEIDSDISLTGKASKKFSFPSTAISIVSFYRFEGASDPGDSAILYLLESTTGQRGVLVDAYGNDADDDVSKFILEVENIQKQKMKDIDRTN